MVETICATCTATGSVFFVFYEKSGITNNCRNCIYHIKSLSVEIRTLIKNLSE